MQEHSEGSLIPKSIIKSRLKLLDFWKSSILEWMHLVRLCIYGNSDLECGLQVHDLKCLDLLFDTMMPPPNTPQSNLIREQFLHFVKHSMHLPPSPFESLLLEKRGFVNVIYDIFPQMNPLISQNTAKIPVEVIAKWIEFAMGVDTHSVDLLEFTKNGVCKSVTVNNEIRETSLKTRNCPVLLQKSRTPLVIVDGKYVKSRTLVISECSDAQFYILGATSNLEVVNCTNLIIYCGLVTRTITISNCESISINGYCTSIVIRDCKTSQPNTASVVAFISCINPIVVSNVGKILVGPPKQWHRGLLNDLKVNGHLSADKMLVNNVAGIMCEVEYVSLASFFLQEIPLRPDDILIPERFCVDQENQSSDTIVICDAEIESKGILLRLPLPYQTASLTNLKMIGRIRDIMKYKTELTETSLKNRILIESEFNLWLKKTGNHKNLLHWMEVKQDFLG